MNKILKISFSCVTSLLLMFSLNSANAALVNYVITGDIVSGDDYAPNVFGLTSGDTITATGTFDDSVLVAGSGVIDFSMGSGNTMTINVGTETFTAANDIDYGSGTGPSIELSSLSLYDFDFLAYAGTNGATVDFSSFFTTFDDFDQMFGDWRTTVEITAVPVPAAVWLFGSGLLALAGVARRKTR